MTAGLVKQGQNRNEQDEPKISILKEQRKILSEILNLNNEVSDKEAISYSEWKVLIYDKTGERLLTPLFNVKHLHDFGVTLYLNIDVEKESIPDSTAIYLCCPTDENVKSICRNISSQTYSSYYINFINPVGRANLERIAETCLKYGCQADIKNVYDQYLNYISVFDNFFCTEPQYVEDRMLDYSRINDVSLQDLEAKELCSTIVSSLVSSIISIGKCPWIICRETDITSEIGSQVHSRLSEYINNPMKKPAFLNDIYPDNHLAVLLIDRTTDLRPMLAHSWNYADLVNDCFGINQNRVNIRNSTKDEDKFHDLMFDDSFWQESQNLVLPIVYETINRRLSEFKEKDKNIRAISQSINNKNQPNQHALTDFEATAEDFSSLIANKPIIMAHWEIISALSHSFTQRKIDKLIEMEDKFNKMQFSNELFAELLKLLDDEALAGSDKLRLALYFYISYKSSLNKIQIDRIESKIKDTPNAAAFKAFIRQTTSISSASDLPQQQQQSLTDLRASGQNSGQMFSFSDLSRMVTQGSKTIFDKVKNYMVNQKSHLVAQNLAALLKGQVRTEDQYRIMHPKVRPKQAQQIFKEDAVNCKTVIVYIVGGGSYFEFQNIQEAFKDKGYNIFYGCTSVYSSNQFLKDIAKMKV